MVMEEKFSQRMQGRIARIVIKRKHPCDGLQNGRESQEEQAVFKLA
jgi:hypothetical protein